MGPEADETDQSETIAAGVPDSASEAVLPQSPETADAPPESEAIEAPHAAEPLSTSWVSAVEWLAKTLIQKLEAVSTGSPFGCNACRNPSTPP